MRQQLLTTVVLFAGGTKYAYLHGILASRLVVKLGYKEFWVCIVGLPFYLWLSANARILAREVGAEFVEVDGKCLDFG